MTEERRDALWDIGLETRRAVVGEDYVGKSLARMDDFDDALQDFVTRTAWETSGTGRASAVATARS